MRPYGSGSVVDRTLACPSWLALPHVGDVSSNAAAQWGTRVHRALQRVYEVGREEALTELDDAVIVEMITALDMSKMPPIDRATAEVAYAIDLDTLDVRRIAAGVDRAEAYAGVGDRELPVTLDLEYVLDDDTVVVDDYKTGWGDLSRPARNGQILTQAYAAMTYHGAARVIGRLVTVRPDRSPWRESDEIDVISLMSFADRLATMRGDVDRARETVQRGEIPPVSEGAHCAFCPAQWSCPAKIGLLHGAVTGDYLETLADSAVSPETAGALYLRLREVRRLIDGQIARIKGLATQTPIPIGDDKVLEQRQRLGNSVVDGRAMYELIQMRYGQESAEAVVEMNSAFTRLRAMLRAHPDVEKVAPTEREIRALLERSGALKRPLKNVVDVFTIEDGED